METPDGKRRSKRTKQNEETKDVAETPQTPSSQQNSSDNDSPGFCSELFRNETFSPPIVTWDTDRPKASPETTAAARRISREIKRHIQARKFRSRILIFSDQQNMEKTHNVLHQKESIEKYKNNVEKIHKRIKDIFGELPTSEKENNEEIIKSSQVNSPLRKVFGSSSNNITEVQDGKMKKETCIIQNSLKKNVAVKHTIDLSPSSDGDQTQRIKKVKSTVVDDDVIDFSSEQHLETDDELFLELNY